MTIHDLITDGLITDGLVTEGLITDGPPIAALVLLLATAYRQPRPTVEAVVAIGAVVVAAAPALVGRSLLDVGQAAKVVADLAPVATFLVAILVVGHVCERAGLFAATGSLLRRRDHSRRRDRAERSGVGLFTTTFVVAAAVTAVLSLDATVVLFTPVVVAAARAQRVSTRPGGYAGLRMANSASLLLPVSNLTNLLALPYLQLTFVGFALTMAPVLVVVLVVEYVGLRLVLRRDLARSPTPASGPVETTPKQLPEQLPKQLPEVPLVPVVVVVLMLVGFAVGSPWHLEPAWSAGAAAAVLALWARRSGLTHVGPVVRAAHLEFAVFVLALGVVVAAISRGFLGDVLAVLLPTSTSFPALLAIAAVATLAANLVTNLSAALLVVPLVAPLGDVAVLAALLGLNIGSGLTLTGSLANLLWRRGLTAYDERPSLHDFHRVSLAVTPVALVAATAALAIVA